MQRYPATDRARQWVPDDVVMAYQADVLDALHEFKMPDEYDKEDYDYVVLCSEVYATYRHWKTQQLASMRFRDEDCTLLMTRAEFGQCFHQAYPATHRHQTWLHTKRVYVYRQIRHPAVEFHRPASRLGRPPQDD